MLVYEHLKTVKSKLAENFISRPLIEILDEMDLLTGPLENRLRTNVIKKKIAKTSDCEETDKTFNYPYQAFEECISNALYHRDYQEHEPVEITVEPTHLD